MKRFIVTDQTECQAIVALVRRNLPAWLTPLPGECSSVGWAMGSAKQFVVGLVVNGRYRIHILAGATPEQADAEVQLIAPGGYVEGSTQMHVIGNPITN